MDRTAPACNHRPVPRNALVFLVLFAVTLISRLTILQTSVLDWDESLYFLMASAWRDGHLPYITIWDNKPIGIYAIFALFQMLWPGTMAMRVATVCFVAALAFAVFRITETLTLNRSAAWFAGLALVLCSLSNDGLSANTELFMATFTAYAVLAALTTNSGLLVGFLIGCAFMVKYVAVFEAPVIFFLFIYRTRRISSASTTILGAAIPLAAAIALYAAADDLRIWLDCSVLSNFRRVAAPVTAAAVHYALTTEALRWGPLYAAGLVMIIWAAYRRTWREIFLGAWLLGGLAGVAASKSFYDHYFLQILPVLCVISGVWLAFFLPRTQQTVFALAMLALPAWAAKTALTNAQGPDIPRLVAATLNAQHATSIYMFDFQPILYALTNQTPPTRYVLPSELVGRTLPFVAGVNAPAEVTRILAAHPEFIIARAAPLPNTNPAIYALLDHALHKYETFRQFPGVIIYKKK